MGLYVKVLNHLVNYYNGLFSDATFIKMRYRVIYEQRLDLKHPKSFNEKIQWLKLHDRKPLYKELADKYNVRKYIADKVGEEYLVPLVGHWEDVNSVNVNELPEKFVIKCTHDSQSVRICNDKSKFDFEEMRDSFAKALMIDYSVFGREWAYQGIKPSVVAEELLVDESGTELKDYKFFCFNGVPKIIQVDYNRFSGHKRRLFDTDWNEMDVKITYPDDKNIVLKRPDKLDEMISICKKLSEGIPFIRVDLYATDKVYVGELTFYPGGGFEPITPYSVDLEWGEWLKLPVDLEKA